MATLKDGADPIVFMGSHAPWDDPKYNGIIFEDLREGRIVPGDIGALQATVQIISYELLAVIRNNEQEFEDLREGRIEIVDEKRPSCPGCLFSDEPWHDLFLTLETSAEPWLYFFEHSEDVDGPQDLDDVSTFIRCHNWSDPSRLEEIAQRVSFFERPAAGAR